MKYTNENKHIALEHAKMRRTGVIARMNAVEASTVIDDRSKVIIDERLCKLEVERLDTIISMLEK